MLSAFNILNATRNSKMFLAVEACLTLSAARLPGPLAWSRDMELSMPNLVEASDIGVVGNDDMPSLAFVLRLRLPYAKAHACLGFSPPNK